MVTRVRPLPSVVGRHDGPADLRAPPPVDATAALHRRILWVHRVHAVLFARGKSFKVHVIPVSAAPSQVANNP